MRSIVLLLLLVAVGVVVWLVLRDRKAKDQAAAAPVDPLRKDARGIDPRKIKVGDVVGYDGSDWVVRGSLAFDQGGFVWHEHHLDDATTRRWLSVEDDEDLEICLWESAVAPELQPGPARLEFGGTTYALDEHGTAAFRATGTTGTADTGEVEFYDYADGDRRLSFERYGSASWEVATGAVVSERELDIYPAGPAVP